MVPNGWSHKLFKQVLKLDRGSSPRPIVNFITESDEGVNWIKIGDTKGDDSFINQTKEKITPEGAKKSRKVSKGEIILSNSMSYGKPYILNIDGYIHDGWFVIREYESHLDKQFLIQVLGSELVQRQYKRLAAGGVVTNISSELVYAVKINFPTIPEQRKIAKILSTWDKAISTTERLIDNSKQQKKALMQQLLTGKKRLLDESGTPFQGEWEEITLEKLAKYRRGSFPQPYGNPEWVDEVNGYPFIQVYDIDKNMKLKPDTKIKISDAAIDRSVFIPKETVIVSLQGSIGRVAITQYDAYVDRTVLLFQEFIVPMDKVFFAFIIQELFEIEKTKAPGGTIKTITKEVLSNFKVYIPSYNEQQKIASVLINADQEIELLEQQLADLKQEKKALMQQLLTGKRRVKVDDEAAA
ncbi:restriction endonuclease subunit S [Alteromonas sp. MmMcT2-5]|uniref:restriction endonuclease subunit S n=1 Tax=Alteromonas sp. MmMcT2-5 TaxID=2917733 RepID=UPI001EF18BED|nr:restriction endonuclease subunit S [Alteromonas sp. MmMcT2-5]MCG7651412.1 restriction endonuclease subunit S [Alteromonas sp. MmMcT2-5]